MEQIILVIHILASIGVIALVLIQQGKGAEVGASFGSGASQTIFGSQGSGSFLTRATAVLITIFFITSLSLGYLANHKAHPQIIDKLLDSDNTVIKTTGSTNESTNASKKSAADSTVGSDIPKMPEN